MNYIYDECSKMLVTCEIGVVRKYFASWLNNHHVPVRTTKSNLIGALDLFAEDMRSHYAHADTSGSILYERTMRNLVNNVLLDAVSDGLQKFYDFTKSAIENYPTDRVTVNKLMSELDEFVVDTFIKTLEDADRSSW